MATRSNTIELCNILGELISNTIFQNELFSRFIPSTYVAWQRRSLGDAAKVERWQH